MLSDELHNESAASSSSTATYYGSNSLSLNMDSDVDERIASLLSSLRLTSLRSKLPQDGEDERLKKIHRQLEWLVNEEPDDHRRRRLRHILPAANCVREQVFVLRRYMLTASAAASANYATHIHAALTAIMKESFEEEYRKLATVVGVLDAVAELLIFEVDAFGIDCATENRTIRKLVASTLTNLTFGNAHSKRRLCSHPNLIEYVIRIIDDSHSLAQVYAGLLRNLSWMADAQMSATLAPSVPALARASLRAYRAAESKCLCATLSALWNLASHSRDNKKAICEEPNFLEMLIDLSTNDAQQTALVEPATGVLKYASMYLAVIGADQYLSGSAVHMMILRLVDLLNSPSFTVIGNSLGVLSQLLAKDHQLRSHIVLNHKAMLLLNHLRNSTRDDIRNPVKTIVSYLSSSDVPGAFAPPPYPSAHGTPSSLGYRLDGMSSSYGGTTSVSPSYLDSTRLLKYRSAQSHAATLLAASAPSNASATDYYPYSAPGCGSTIQQGFAPRPGDRSQQQQQQQQFASLPRQFFQKNKLLNISSRAQPDDGTMFFEQQTQTTQATRFSPSDTISSARYPNHPEQKDMSTSTTTTSGFALENPPQDLNPSNAGDGDDTGLSRLNRPDDPSFEVEDSVRCTRCTSTQSLSSLLPGERSTWDSCNNSAAESNRLSPLSATEIPDSPTLCSQIPHDSATLSARDFDITTSTDGNVDDGCRAQIVSKSKDEVLRGIQRPDAANSTAAAATTTTEDNRKLSSNSDDSSSSSNDDKNVGDNVGHENSGDDDYGSFMGRADSELLNQSIEAAMPKRVEINEEFLADMIEQAQPKPSPVRHHSTTGAGRNFPRASTSKIRSGSSITKTDDDDFLLQSIASVLPQSSGSRRDASGGVIGSPPKKVRAMTGDTARASNGPKHIPKRAVLSNAHSHQTHSCSVVRMKESKPNDINLKKSTKFGSKISTPASAALFDAALRSSSLVESSKTTEKVRDASSLVHHQPAAEESDTLSDDNYSPLTDNNMTVDKNVPQDVDEEFQAEQLVIDCSVVSETVKQTAVRPLQKTSATAHPVIPPHRFGKTQKNLSRRSSEQEMFALPAPLSSGSSAGGSPLITSTPKNSSSLLKSTFTGKTSKQPVSISKPMHERGFFASTDSSRIRNSYNINIKSTEKYKDQQRGCYQASSLPRPKQSVIAKPKLNSSFRSSSSSRISTHRASSSYRNRAATPDVTTKMPPQNYGATGWNQEISKPREIRQELLMAKNRSRIEPFSYRNSEEEKAVAQAIAPENDRKPEDGSVVTADTENDTSTAHCENRSTTAAADAPTAVKKKAIKQMIITTV